MKKVIVVFLIIVIVLCSIPIVTSHIISYINKAKINSIVRNNLKPLNNFIKNGSYSDLLEIKGIKDIHIFETDEGNTYIDYFISGFGIVPSGVYYGFYYHSVDEPIGYQGTSVELTKDGQGWSWNESNGDNWYYTEKIEDHWYYYEAGF